MKKRIAKKILKSKNYLVEIKSTNGSYMIPRDTEKYLYLYEKACSYLSKNVINREILVTELSRMYESMIIANSNNFPNLTFGESILEILKLTYDSDSIGAIIVENNLDLKKNEDVRFLIKRLIENDLRSNFV